MYEILSIYRLRREAEQVDRQLEAAAAETRRLRDMMSSVGYVDNVSKNQCYVQYSDFFMI